jgi:putative ABC transport system permease protein
MLLSLATANLRRHRARTLLAIAGVAVSAAMLLDMVMLASGMRESFRELMLTKGYQIRVTPRGTLPFDSEASIDSAASFMAALGANPDVDAVNPVLGAQLHLVGRAGSAAGSGAGAGAGAGVSITALGVVPATQADYDLVEGRDIAALDELVANDYLLRAAGLQVGDTVTLAAGYDPQVRTYTGRRSARVVGRVRFIYFAAEQRAAALPLAVVQEMTARPDRASLFVVRVRAGASDDSVAHWIERSNSRVSASSIREVLRQTDERLSYFRQLAFILGAVSFVVGFLLVTTLVTVSVNERLGEIAVLRAIGVRRARIVALVVIEGTALMAIGTTLGLALGLVTARYLNGILAGFPGLPERIDFFLFQPRAAWTALGLLALAGVLAGIYPSWRGASLPIATTLREEAVG